MTSAAARRTNSTPAVEHGKRPIVVSPSNNGQTFATSNFLDAPTPRSSVRRTSRAALWAPRHSIITTGDATTPEALIIEEEDDDFCYSTHLHGFSFLRAAESKIETFFWLSVMIGFAVVMCTDAIRLVMDYQAHPVTTFQEAWPVDETFQIENPLRYSISLGRYADCVAYTAPLEITTATPTSTNFSTGTLMPLTWIDYFNGVNKREDFTMPTNMSEWDTRHDGLVMEMIVMFSGHGPLHVCIDDGAIDASAVGLDIVEQFDRLERMLKVLLIVSETPDAWNLTDIKNNVDRIHAVFIHNVPLNATADVTVRVNEWIYEYEHTTREMYQSHDTTGLAIGHSYIAFRADIRSGMLPVVDITGLWHLMRVGTTEYKPRTQYTSYSTFDAYKACMRRVTREHDCVDGRAVIQMRHMIGDNYTLCPVNQTNTHHANISSLTVDCMNADGPIAHAPVIQWQTTTSHVALSSTKDPVDQFLLRVRTKYYFKIQEEPRFTLRNLFATLGGVFGVWFGASFISFLHVGVYWLKKTLKKRRLKNNVSFDSKERRMGVSGKNFEELIVRDRCGS